MGRFATILGCALMLGSVACGGDARYDEPADLGKAFAKAAAEGDLDGVRAMFATVVQMHRTMTCHAGDDLVAPLARSVRETDAQRAELAKWRSFVRIDEATRWKARTLNKGDAFEGCKAIETHRIVDTRWIFEVAEGSRAKQHAEDVTLIEFSDVGWRVLARGGGGE